MRAPGREPDMHGVPYTPPGQSGKHAYCDRRSSLVLYITTEEPYTQLKREKKGEIRNRVLSHGRKKTSRIAGEQLYLGRKAKLVSVG